MLIQQRNCGTKLSGLRYYTSYKLVYIHIARLGYRAGGREKAL